MNPVNAANRATEEVREEEGVLGVSFPRAGKAGVLKNSIFSVVKKKCFFHYVFLFKTAKKPLLGR